MAPITEPFSTISCVLVKRPKSYLVRFFWPCRREFAETYIYNIPRMDVFSRVYTPRERPGVSLSTWWNLRDRAIKENGMYTRDLELLRTVFSRVINGRSTH